MRLTFYALALGASFAIIPAAQAELRIYAFKGSVQGGDYADQSVRGWFSYDADRATATVETANQRSDSGYTLTGEAPYAKSFVTLSGGKTFRAGSNGRVANSSRSSVTKATASSPRNQFVLSAESEHHHSRTVNLKLTAGDDLGPSSLLFPDTGAGLATDQVVDWHAGVVMSGFVYDRNWRLGTVDSARLIFDSVRLVSSVPESSTSALMLVGVGLLGVAAKRRSGRRDERSGIAPS